MHAMLRSAWLAVPILALLTISGEARTCRPEDYGAAHDGRHDDTAAIQKAIDACGTGDEIVMSQGTYLSGPLTLSSGDTLVVAKGATLLGTPDHDAYRDGGGKLAPLIGAHDARDITLTGEGTIDGNGASWWSAFRTAKAAGQDMLRPKMIVLTRVTSVKVTELTLRNSPMFHLVLDEASKVVVDGLNIRAPVDAPNTDGIDPSGRDMVLKNLRIDVGDDDIAIKSGHENPQFPGAATDNIVIRDCTFLHGHGLSIGSETIGGVHNVVAENIAFDGTTNGIRIKTDRGIGGPVDSITYRNLTMANVGQAILITDYYPRIPKTDTARPVGPGTPDIHGITIAQLRVTDAATAGGLYGLPERPLYDIALTDVTIHATKGLTVRNATASLQGTLDVASGQPLILEENGRLTRRP